MALINQEGVSVVVHAESFASSETVFASFNNQDHKKKELIICIKGRADWDRWLARSRMYPMVRVYAVDAGMPKGECLNYSIDRAVYGNIAIFDEHGNYRPAYIKAGLESLINSGAALTGRPALSVLDHEGRLSDYVILPTFVFRTEIFNHVKFPGENIGLDYAFCRQCHLRGFRIFYSDMPYYSRGKNTEAGG